MWGEIRRRGFGSVHTIEWPLKDKTFELQLTLSWKYAQNIMHQIITHHMCNWIQIQEIQYTAAILYIPFKSQPAMLDRPAHGLLSDTAVFRSPLWSQMLTTRLHDGSIDAQSHDMSWYDLSTYRQSAWLPRLLYLCFEACNTVMYV